MKVTLLSSFLILSAASSWSLAERSAEPDRAHTDRPGLRASSDNVFKGESFQLFFTTPNPSYLGVIDPSGHFFYVVFPEEYGVGGIRPVIASEKFTFTKSLRIQPASFKADPYTYGVDQNQPVFTQSGAYTFILGDNLHVDDPALVSRITVQYHHYARPKAKAGQAVASASR